MSFDPSNREHKKQLYPVLRKLSDLDPRKTPELLIDDACGRPLARGKDYIHNVRKGDFAKSIAEIVYQWLLINHFAIAKETSPAIFTETVEMLWRKIVEQRAIVGQLRIIPSSRELNIVRPVREINSAETTIKLGQEFSFELKSKLKGYAVLMQGVRSKWYPISLQYEEHYHLPIKKGINIFPQLRDGKPDPVVESHDLGLHEFVLVLAHDTGIPHEIKNLISWLQDHEFSMYRKKCNFVK